MPSDPNVIAALEGFVRHYAAQQIEIHEKHCNGGGGERGAKVGGGGGGGNGNGKHAVAAAVDKGADLQLVRDAINVCMEVQFIQDVFLRNEPCMIFHTKT